MGQSIVPVINYVSVYNNNDTFSIQQCFIIVRDHEDVFGVAKNHLDKSNQQTAVCRKLDMLY